MQKSVSRRQLYWMIVFAALATLAGWSWSLMTAGREVADTAVSDLAKCRQLADEIKRVGRDPQKATFAAHSATDLARLLEQSAKTARLPADAIVGIDPQAPRRLGETVYREQATHLELRNVTLQQLVTFLHGLSQDDSGMDVAQLRLRAPRDERHSTQASELWTAEVTLTQLVFAP